ncbi:3-hydroxyacyl-CoA dehydrogenase, NAD binding domain protein [Anoxybacillus sp. B7M1]|jgi:D-amino-acid dehydrogenase|uniref:NAD(P)/FAD-dependent oxidoreductase n=1 Tax=unclassified Anoxybacillus TaxID=2639704 RepID=UPI0005CCE92B|nr:MULTISPECIES: FAD-binding oxidoreductase [unclassified Anoxybacillus]ANB58816.1 3-hydroxyacyl-CoA dehydrogenase, NAD binding domain protein [Anoxybacillus sp. B2M1]ANB63494.1 3-hydroxyacyl-CoA dehydrogenase, NAD binding domain protein [Anoxybacillus sp. B7M1]
MKSYIVVGAGILGASTAYHLAREGAAVTIIDRGDKGQATAAAAGIVCPWVSQRRNQVWYRLARGGAKFYPSFIQELQSHGETETGYERVGALCLHTDKEKLEKMMDRTLQRRQEAPEIGEVTKLSFTQAKQLFPALAEGYEAVYVSGAARVNGKALRDALVRAAQKLGATYIKGNAKIVHQHSHVNGVEVAGTYYQADAVVITAGAWAKELLLPLGIEFLVTPQRAQIIHLEKPEQDTDLWPVVMPPSNQYLLAFRNGRIVVGATHEDGVGFDCRATAGGVYEILHKALAIAPGLSDCTHSEIRVGFRPYTPGFLPVFGALPGFTGIYVANGLGASGLTAGPYLGCELAKLVLGQPTELDPFDYNVAGAIKKIEERG